jgi:tetratricopeptide (TPR) repeat protein
MILKLTANLVRHVLDEGQNSEATASGILNDGEDGEDILHRLLFKEGMTYVESLLLAAAFSDAGMVKDADKGFKNCLRERPDDAAAHLLYAMHAIQWWQRARDATIHFEEALKLERKNVAYPYYYGFSLWTAGRDPLKVREMFERAIELDENCASTHNELGLLLWDVLGRPDEAEEHFKKAISAAPEDARGYGMCAVYLMEYKREIEDAKAMFEKALTLDPNDALNHFDYGRLLTSEYCRYDDALEHMNKAVELDPGNSRAHIWTSWLQLIAFRDIAKAREEMRVGMLLERSRIVSEASLDRRVDEELLKWIDFEIENEGGNPEKERALRAMAAEVRQGTARAID